MKNIEVVILANSLKHHQHCIAGKCTSSGRWIRPVSNNNGAELNDAQAKCENRYGVFNVKPLQKVIMNFSNHAPLPHQPENYVIDGSVWKQKFNISEEELSRYILLTSTILICIKISMEKEGLHSRMVASIMTSPLLIPTSIESFKTITIQEVFYA